MEHGCGLIPGAGQNSCWVWREKLFIEHVLDTFNSLSEKIEIEYVFIVGYLGDKIQELMAQETSGNDGALCGSGGNEGPIPRHLLGEGSY